MNRPEPCKPSAQRLTARGVLGAPQTFAFSCPASIPFGAEILPHGADAERTKASGRGARLGETGGADSGARPGRQKLGSLSWCAGGTAARIWSRQGRRAAGYTWRCSRAFGRAGRGGRGGNALGVSRTVPRHTSRPLARTHVFSASRSPPQGRGGPRCASVTCSGRLRPCWSTELPPPGPQPQPRPSHQVFTRHPTG